MRQIPVGSLATLLVVALFVVPGAASTSAAASRTRATVHAAPHKAARPVDPADLALYEKLSALTAAAYDSARGGWVSRDGTPSEAAIELALVRGRDGDALAASRAAATLRWMHALMDTVGGGYVNGTHDMESSSSSLDKFTGPNARRLELLTLAMSGGGNAAVGRDARATADYFERVLSDPRGGFFTGQVGSRDLEPEANGQALVAWWRYAALTGDARRREFCWKTQDRLWAETRDPELGMVRRDTWGNIHDPSLLADQAESGRAYLVAWQYAGRDSDLAHARMLGRLLLAHFEDRAKWGFREEYAYERLGHSRRSPRPFDDNGRAARFLAELGAATGEAEFTSSARRAFSTFAQQMEKPRLETAEWALALRATWAGSGATRATWHAPAKAAPARNTTHTYKTRGSGRR